MERRLCLQGWQPFRQQGLRRRWGAPAALASEADAAAGLLLPQLLPYNKIPPRPM